MNENENENDNDDYEIKQVNNCFKMIDETKSFEEQINLLREIDLSDYWHMKHDYDKELNLKIFMLKIAYILEDLDENLFEKIFGLTSVKLLGKLINTTSKEDNQILINLIETNKDKIFQQDKFNIWAIKPPHKRGDLLDAVKVILEFNKTIQPYLTLEIKFL